MRNAGAGKGDAPRLGQYSPRAIAAFSRGHERAFGKSCIPCRGKGFTWDEDSNGNMVKHSCLICKGTGRIR